MTKYDFSNSSWITHVFYDDETKEMVVHTQFRTYALVGVPKSVYDAFESSTSKGKYFNDSLKGQYVDRMFKP